MKKIISVVAVCFFLFSCSKSGSENDEGSGNSGSGGGTTCVGPAKSFTTDVMPVIQGSCATSQGCHGAGSTAGPGSLLTFSQVFNARISIRSAVSSGLMPLNGSLSETQRNAITCWIDNGALNN
ncbi:MAG TPA: hypothetical protein VGQ04_07545 [Chitinophagaceae bacterium]|nr:hypothetical protein [Chitinophagaceae bacterium]